MFNLFKKQSLLNTLRGLKQDPTLVVKLYKQLFEAEYFLLVRKGAEQSLNKTEFLIYDSKDKIKELPLFTTRKFIIKNLSSDTLVVKNGGQLFWVRLLDVVETGKCEIAIDPEQEHSVRLTKEMILGMIANYGVKTEKY